MPPGFVRVLSCAVGGYQITYILYQISANTELCELIPDDQMKIHVA